MNIIDTSVWIEFFKGNSKVRFIQELLDKNKIINHPFVYGELLLGGLKPADSALFKFLLKAKEIELPLLYRFIIERKLSGLGIGLIDTAILFSCILETATLYTMDKKLENASKKLGVQFEL